MPEAQAPGPGGPATPVKLVLCPYCGELSRDAARCDACRGNFDPLSRQATQNSMGPWFIRDAASPYRPGCSWEVLRGLIRRGKIEANTVLRGPTTNQFWAPARRAPGVANLLGLCHNCGGPAGEDDVACVSCGATFRYHDDRQHLGLTEVRLLPGQASPEEIASGQLSGAARPVAPRLSMAAVPTTAARVQSPRSPAPEARNGVPLWVLLLAALCVVGAVTAAAWIMNKLPGLPSPILGEVAGPDSKADSSNGVLRSESPEKGASVLPVPEASTQTSGGPASSETAPQPAAASHPESPGAAVAARPGDEAFRLLCEGGEAELRRALQILSDASIGSEGVSVARAAGQLLSQLPLRKLP